VIGGTRVISNAKGYGYPIWDNNPQFDPNLVVEI
jgi:hypothetical protein